MKSKPDEVKKNLRIVFDIRRIPKKIATQSIGKEKSISTSYNSECRESVKSLFKKGLLNKHVRRSHQKLFELFQCDICGKNFNSKLACNGHKAVHSSSKKIEQSVKNVSIHKCPKCPKSFPEKDSLRTHFDLEHPKKGETKKIVAETTINSPKSEINAKLDDFQNDYKVVYSNKNFDFTAFVISEDQIRKNWENQMKKAVKALEHAGVTDYLKWEPLLQFEQKNIWTFTCFADTATNTASKVEVTQVPEIYTSRNIQFPPYISHIMKVFSVFHKEMMACKTKENRENFKIKLLVNHKEHVSATVISDSEDSILEKELKNLHLHFQKTWKVKSLIYETPNFRKYIAGLSELLERVGNFQVDVNQALSDDPWRTQFSAKAIDEFLKISFQDTFLDIGCANGLRALLLAHVCKKVIGIDSEEKIILAENLKKRNKVENVTFIAGFCQESSVTLRRIKPNEKVVAVIDCTSHFSGLSSICCLLRNMASLDRLVVLMPLQNMHRHVLPIFSKPPKESLITKTCPLFVKRACPLSFGKSLVLRFFLERQKSLR